MNNFVLNINSDSLQAHVHKLRKMHKSALPNAIRETLSKSALNVKQDTMPKSAKKEFVNRQPNFFKANSSVNFAKGYDVKSMKATIGFIDTKLKGGKNNYAVNDLEQQEHGGAIGGRSFVPLDEARTGKNKNKLVKKVNRLTAIDLKDVVSVSRRRSMGKAINIKSKKQAFIRAAIMAKKLHGDNAYVLGNNKNGFRTLSRINSVSTNRKSRNLQIDRTPLYSYRQGRAARVQATNFMRRASMETQSKMDATFIKEAQKQFDRIRK